MMQNITTRTISNLEELDAVIKAFSKEEAQQLDIAIKCELRKKEQRVSYWNKVFDSLAAHLPNLHGLSMTTEGIPAPCLSKLAGFTELKSLSFYWTGIEEQNFFDYVPDTVEHLDLSRSNSCRIHTAEQFKKMLERLTHLKKLDLAETDLASFPKMELQNKELIELELFHHTIWEPNQHLTVSDLENIIHNFPNLKKLNIIDCKGIDINDPKTQELINELADRKDFQLHSSKGISDCFALRRHYADLVAHYPLTQKQAEHLCEKHPSRFELLSSYYALHLLEHGATPEELMSIASKDEPLLKALTSVYPYHFLHDNIVTYHQLKKLIGKNPENWELLFNFGVKELITTNNVSFTSVEKLFHTHPKILYAMGDKFFNRYEQSKEILELQIAMLVAPKSADKALFKKLPHPNPNIKTLSLQELPKEYYYCAKDIENILYNFPNLDSLKISSHIRFDSSANAQAALKQVLEAHCRKHPEFELNTGWNREMGKIYSQIRTKIKYTTESLATKKQLDRLEKAKPELFHALMETHLPDFIKAVSWKFRRMMVLYKKYPQDFATLTSTIVHDLVTAGKLNFAQGLALFVNNKEKFAQLTSYSLAQLMIETDLSWDELSEIYDNKPDMFKKLTELAKSYTISDKQASIDKLRKQNSVADTKEESSEDESETNTFSLKSFGFFADIKNAFNREQATVVAEWFYSIIEDNTISDIYCGLNYVKKPLQLQLDDDKKAVFIKTLSDSLWNILENDLSWSIKGQSPLYVYWKSDLITQALAKADIPIDNNNDLLIIAFIGQNNLATYQLGSKVGECDEYVADNKNIRLS